MTEEFIPLFMQNKDEYQLDKSKIKTVEEWILFSKKWFIADRVYWPKCSTPTARARVCRALAEQVDNRSWGLISTLWNIPPEAYYEMGITCAKIGDPLQFDHMYDEQGNPRDIKLRGWMHECGFCRLCTHDIRANLLCPACGRTLYFTWIEYD